MKLATLAAILLGSTSLAVTAVSAQPPAPYALETSWAGPDGGWDFSSFDSIHRRFYVARSDGVTAVDVDTGQVTPHLLPASRTHAAIPVNDGAEVLVTVGTTGSALIANARTGAVRASIPTGPKPDAALVEPATGLGLVFDNAGGGIALIDTRSGTSVGTISVPGGLESAASDGSGKVYVNVEDLNEIVVVDIRARRVLSHYPLTGCEAPSGIAYIPATRRLVSACSNHVAKVVSAATGEIVASLTIGGRPDWADFDAKTGLVLLPTGEDGVINLISAASEDAPAVVGKIPGHVGSRSGAIDTTEGRFYMPSADFTVTAGARPVATPGTFRILVYDPAR